jgi:hypothetical protein
MSDQSSMEACLDVLLSTDLFKAGDAIRLCRVSSGFRNIVLNHALFWQEIRVRSGLKRSATNAAIIERIKARCCYECGMRTTRCCRTISKRPILVCDACISDSTGFRLMMSRREILQLPGWNMTKLVKYLRIGYHLYRGAYRKFFYWAHQVKGFEFTGRRVTFYDRDLPLEDNSLDTL